MSRSVKSPTTTAPEWACEINGKVYSYPSGTTQTVPDEVAAVIANLAASEPKEAGNLGSPGQVLTRTETGTCWTSLPKGKAVADAAGNAPTAAEFKALLDSLRAAGLIAG